jgi:hypothetical protein
VAAAVLAAANLFIWLIYVAPLLRHPRLSELTGLALGTAMLGFSAAIVLLSLLAARANTAGAMHVVVRPKASN